MCKKGWHPCKQTWPSALQKCRTRFCLSYVNMFNNLDWKEMLQSGIGWCNIQCFISWIDYTTCLANYTWAMARIERWLLEYDESFNLHWSPPSVLESYLAHAELSAWAMSPLPVLSNSPAEIQTPSSSPSPKVVKRWGIWIIMAMTYFSSIVHLSILYGSDVC